MEILSRQYNIHYKACVGSLIYLFSSRVDLYLSAHKLEMFSSNNGKVNVYGLIQLLRYIRYNKNLGLKYYDKIEDSPLSDLLGQAFVNTDRQLMMFSYYRW